MVCQSTCLDFAASENQVVNNSIANFCPASDNAFGNRTEQLTKDFTDCTDWTTLATNNSESCVSGDDNGENNCGFGSSTIQLCAHCSGDEPEACCYSCEFFVFFNSPRHSSDTLSLSLCQTRSFCANWLELIIANTDMSVCGFALAPQPTSSGTASDTSTSASGSGSATAAPGNNQNGSSTLTGGKLAGTIVGSVLGGLLVSSSSSAFPPS